MEEKIQQILGKKWKPLLENCKNIEDGNYPGIYLLAFSDRNLEGEVVKPSDIFYVGMSNARKGLTSRVQQFINGIEKNGSHSAGMRFYKENSKGIAFSECNHLEKFYIISSTFKCDVNKLSRTPNDLRIMGDICRLEYYLLAYIKEVTNTEPNLNKK
ncbi:hypothetical protein C8C85_3446 [Flavobacterium sp. 103]|jgi:hypothetical protein|uniref:GIY-YIG domain-containing protein n=1 Tax=Flavobacterium aquariorum TaxID=2217670 RepID=A0A2W7TX40_9FLAO|nr:MULTISPECIES: hypothetical protein [Flavobacterium]PVX47503.1 hypothetical protein C8C85_3446 [Flavobacterium sp. 103]PZX93350.1 hypothetical protein DOS84_10830 [Flavobacterium aquariorum]